MDIEAKKTNYKRYLFRGILFIYDAFAVNFAYFMAIIVRFYIEYTWHDMGAQYIQMLKHFSPYYTAFSLIIFLIFRLYSGVWRYAGFNDIRKIILANICTCAFHVIGSLVIVGRMPITYYCIGACIQFVMMCIPRIAPRFILDTFGSISRQGRSGSIDIPLMIVGVGENTRIIQNKMSQDGINVVKPVCVADYDGRHTGTIFNGLPVVSGKDGIASAIEKYGVKLAIISDNNVPDEVSEAIRSVCKQHDVELRDFTIRAELRASSDDDLMKRYSEETGERISFF